MPHIQIYTNSYISYIKHITYYILSTNCCKLYCDSMRLHRLASPLEENFSACTLNQSFMLYCKDSY